MEEDARREVVLVLVLLLLLVLGRKVDGCCFCLLLIMALLLLLLGRRLVRDVSEWALSMKRKMRVMHMSALEFKALCCGIFGDGALLVVGSGGEHSAQIRRDQGGCGSDAVWKARGYGDK
mmetsp:Transcript_37048/g.67998  ORF Transcript_37048/g.67998 Transcript_37048/m.67998 type:complete len:120 (+) Transcript_37048:1355-1714(+)